MKFATHILLFGQEKWVLKNLENVYSHVDKIYAAYSELPWGYNPNAKNQYKNTFDINTIRNSKYADKIHLIEGIWDFDEDQRNSCLIAAKNDGMDYLLTIDADEFYFHDQLDAIKNQIIKNPDYDYYNVYWQCFWKDFNHVLLDEKGSPYVGTPEICVNLKRDVRFIRCRRPTPDKSFTIPKEIGVCYHGSYVLSDQEIWKKINTWGHAHQFNTKIWFDNVWLNWSEKSTNLHPISPSAWSKAVKFDGQLPEVIADME